MVRHNSLGLRQHREFDRNKPAQTTRIGFFGDSFTENVRMPVQYSFTEPLDFLLNRTGKAFEVLNFGTDGYGTDQVYLQYMEEGKKSNLDFVVYLYCENDLRDILANKLIDIDEKGNIKYIPALPSGLFVSTVKKFYLTYLLLEALLKWNVVKDNFLNERLDPNKIRDATDHQEEGRRKYEALARQLEQDPENPELKHALKIFSALMQAMKKESESNSSRLYVVLFPGYKSNNKGVHNQKITKVLEGLGIDVLDLFPVFRQTENRHRLNLYFKKDNHWNEEGNKIAAVEIFKFLAEKLGLVFAGDAFIKEGLNEYYSSFPPVAISDVWLQKKPLRTT
ncbi:MAG: hypothetical protein ACE5G9_00735 [Nitrospinales bacterium]